MRLTKAEQELIELLRKRDGSDIIIHRPAVGGNFVVWVSPHPLDETTATMGIGVSFDDAWATRRTIGELEFPH